MLVLTQAAVGTLTIQSLLDWATDASVGLGATSLGVALIIQVAALVASVFHLGRPHLAFRAVLGLRTSWLSREILTFGGFTAVLAAYWFASFTDIPSVISMPLQAASLAMGWAGVFCSAMVYIVTRRDFWNASATFAKFLLTSVVLGIAVSLLLLSWSERYSFSSVGAIACGCVVVSTLLKSAVELSVLRHLRGPDDRTLKRSALLLTGELGPTFKVRLICALAGGISLPIAWLTLAGDQPVGQFLPAAVSVAAVAVLLSGELLERYLFFTAVVAPRMPRGL